MGLEDLQHNFLTGTLEGVVKWARASSSWGANFGLACCAIEMMATGAANFDLARFGMEVFRASPRQADVLIVAGRVSQKMTPVLRQVYDQMMEPKWVIAMGVCASTGGMFNNYAVVQGVDQIVPVDVYTPGCPPGPETLIHSILTLHQKIRVGELTRRAGTSRPLSLYKPGLASRAMVRARSGGGGKLTELIQASTAEGAQEMAPRAHTTAPEMTIEEGTGALITGDGLRLNRMDMDVEVHEEQMMILNLGPSHPSTHGVLRVMVELDGETVLRSKPVVGYLHTGMEKTGEELAYHQGSTNVTRMDYLAPFFNELAFCLSVERLLEVDIPPRAMWIRMLMCELNRISSHFLWLGTNGADLGFLNMLVYGWREREMILAFFEKVTGLRMNHEYIRPGGVVADLPDGWRDDILSLCEAIPKRMDEYDQLLTDQPILHGRLEGVGPIDAGTAISLGLTGPLLRSTGVAWDLRRDQPYLAYDDVDFDVIVGTNGDCWDRFAIRFNEIRESTRIIRQIADMMPAGDFRTQDKKITPPPRNRIDESMEALIMHFKLYTEGFRVPAGDAYVPIEGPRGEIGCYIVSDGTSKPYRLHMRAPSFANLQALPHLARGALVADTVAIVSTIDPVLGDVDR